MASSRNYDRMSRDLIKASREGREDDVRRLIERGVDANAVDANGNTALHCASSYGHVDTVNLLLTAGVDVHAVDKDGNTALHYASIYGHVDTVSLLLTAGADVHAVNKRGNTALHWASLYGHVNIANMLLDTGVNNHAVNKDGDTALHLASFYGRVNIVSVLLAAGADVHAVDKYGETALDLARSRGHQDVVNVLQAHLDKVNVQSQKKAIAQQTAAVTAGVTAGTTAALTEGTKAGAKLKSVKVSNKHRVTTQYLACSSEPVAIVMPPVERDDDIGVLTQEMAQLNRGQIPEADLKTLRYFHRKIKRDLCPFPLIDYLYEKDVIDEDQLEIITITKQQHGRAASIAKMLEILKVCGNHAFQLFLECLEQEDVVYAGLASELREHRYGGAQP